MNRKHFISSALASALVIPSLSKNEIFNAEETVFPVLPKYLKEGDTIGITSPAGYITWEEIFA